MQDNQIYLNRRVARLLKIKANDCYNVVLNSRCILICHMTMVDQIFKFVKHEHTGTAVYGQKSQSQFFNRGLRATLQLGLARVNLSAKKRTTSEDLFTNEF